MIHKKLEKWAPERKPGTIVFKERTIQHINKLDDKLLSYNDPINFDTMEFMLQSSNVRYH